MDAEAGLASVAKAGAAEQDKAQGQSASGTAPRCRRSQAGLFFAHAAWGLSHTTRTGPGKPGATIGQWFTHIGQNSTSDRLTGQSIMMDGANALATGGNFYPLRN